MKTRNNIRNIAYLATNGCTGFPGEIGDGLLQSSLAITLSEGLVFPCVENVDWYCPPAMTHLLINEEAGKKTRLIPWKKAEDPLPPRNAVYDLCLVCHHQPETVIQNLNEQFSNADIFSPQPALNPQSDTHLTKQLHSALRDYQTDIEIPKPRINLIDCEISRARGYIEALQLKENNYVVCGISSGDPRRLWSVKKWTEFIEKALTQMPVLIFHGPSDKDREYASEVYSNFIAGVYLRSTSLRNLAAVSLEAKVCIAPDSGPMHVMSAAGAKVVDIISVMNPKTWDFASDKVVLAGKYPNEIDTVEVSEVIRAAGLG